MKNQDIFPSDEIQKIFSEGVSKLSKFFQPSEFRKFFQRKSFVENLIENFNRGVDFFATQAKETTSEFTEGGIRIQENRPKSGGREETQTK